MNKKWRIHPVRWHPPPTSHTDRQTGRRTYKQNTWHKPWQHPFFSKADGLATCYSTWIDSNRLSCELPPFPHGWESSSNSRSPANVDRQIRHPNSSRTRTTRLMKTPHILFSLTQKMMHKNSHFILIFNDELVTRNSISIHIVCSRGNATTCFLNGRVPPARFRTVIMSKV
jgi:hypothetical protein